MTEGIGKEFSTPDMSSRKDVMQFVMNAHNGQKDKLGMPYYMHPFKVAELIPDATDDEYRAALLHDVLEDTDYTAEQLLEMGVPEYTVKLVVGLTRTEGTTYADYIDSIIESGTVALMRIKIADLTHNLDPARLYRLPEEQVESLGNRYRKAREKLCRALTPPESHDPTTE
jgi:(p)ppGpp synthase/HD superfamily hydrolase